MSMLPGVGEPAGLFFMIFVSPVEFPPGRADREGCMKINQDIRFGDDLPHVRYVGMFLCDVTARVAVFFKPCDKRGFPRAAVADDTDKR